MQYMRILYIKRIKLTPNFYKLLVFLKSILKKGTYKQKTTKKQTIMISRAEFPMKIWHSVCRNSV